MVALTDHIEAARVSEEAHVVSLDLDVVLRENTVGPVQEPK